MNPEINQLTNNAENPILNIVNEIQSKLNEKNKLDETFSSSQSQNINNKGISGLDISKMIEMLNNMNKNNYNDLNNMNLNNSSSGINLDPTSIMNFEKVLNSINQRDPRQDLLTSLKPFLRETRQKNIDTYITLLGVMKTINLFTNKDRD